MAAQYKALYPWIGGLNTAQDPIILDPQNLVQCDNVVFTTSGSRRKRGGQSRYNTSALGTASFNLVYFTPYWAVVSNAKRERFVSVGDNGKIYRSTPGSGTWSSFSTLTLTVAHGGVTTEVMENDLVIGLSGNGVPKRWVGQNTSSNIVAMTAGGTTALPFTNAWILRYYISRGFYAGDPANPDRLYVSDAGDYDKFTSGTTAGNSITLEIGTGDGDPEGITAIFPGTGYNRVLYVAKRRHLYAVNCSSTDQTTWSVTLITNQLGVINPNAVKALDETDVAFCSDRGVHLLSQVLSTTAIIPGEFLSFPIQPDYQSVMNAGTRSKMSLVYYPQINSILLSCRRVGVSTYETIYGYNIVLKQWFRWTSTPCNFLAIRFNTTTGEDELYGCDARYLNLINTSGLNDFGSAITVTLTSSFIYPDGIPLNEYSFIRFILIFRSRDNGTFTVQYSLDGIGQNSFSVQERTAGGNVLGSTTLGTSFILGSIQGVKPYFQNVSGTGASVQFTISHNGLNQDFELFGLVIEYDNAGDNMRPYDNPAYG